MTTFLLLVGYTMAVSSSFLDSPFSELSSFFVDSDDILPGHTFSWSSRAAILIYWLPHFLEQYIGEDLTLSPLGRSLGGIKNLPCLTISRGILVKNLYGSKNSL